MHPSHDNVDWQEGTFIPQAIMLNMYCYCSQALLDCIYDNVLLTLDFSLRAK